MVRMDSTSLFPATYNSLYGTPRSTDESTISSASRIPYAAALARMRQLSREPAEAFGPAAEPLIVRDPLIQLTQQDREQESADRPSNGGSRFPPVHAASPRRQAAAASARREEYAREDLHGRARTGGLYCPGEDCATHQMWNLRGDSAEPAVILPQARGGGGASGRLRVREARHAPASAAVNVVGWKDASLRCGSSATVRGFKATPADEHSEEVLARLQCVPSLSLPFTPAASRPVLASFSLPPGPAASPTPTPLWTAPSPRSNLYGCHRSGRPPIACATPYGWSVLLAVAPLMNECCGRCRARMATVGLQVGDPQAEPAWMRSRNN